MENSFKKTYDKTTNPNGSVSLSFKSQRFGVSGSASMGLLLVIILFPTSCAITFPLLYVFGLDIMRQKILGVLLWNIFAMVVFQLILRVLAFSKKTIKVIPKEGLAFEGKQLPFKDIQDLGVMNDPNNAECAYVYANTQGQQIKITNPMPLAQAQALYQEIAFYRS